MNGNRAVGPAIVIAAIMFGMYAATSVLLSSGNNIGEFCTLLLVGGFLVCFLDQRTGFFLWIAFCGYNDLLKRFLVVGGRITWGDLTHVLAISPVAFCGLILGVLFQGLMGNVTLRKSNWGMFALASVMMVLSAASSAVEGGGGLMQLAKSLANEGIYAYLLFVIPIIFNDEAKIYALLRYVIWVFLPVAIYGIYQQYAGLSDLEVAYLKTGYSIEIKQLMGIEARRAFSTLNSSSALSVVCATLTALSWHLGVGARRAGIKPLLPVSVSWLLILANFGAVLASTCRSAVVMIPLGLILGHCYNSKRGTQWIYVAAFLSFVGLVSFAPLFMSNLEFLMDKITVTTVQGGVGEWVQRMTTVGTYSDRLRGFSNVLLNPNAYSLFGKGASALALEEYSNHDPISNALIKYGVLPCLAVFILVGLLAMRLHREIYCSQDPARRRMGARFVGIAFSILLISMLGGNILTVFPVNVFFWMLLGCASALHNLEPQPVQEPAEEVAVPSSRVRRGIQRFAPTEGIQR